MKWQFDIPQGSAGITLNAEIICASQQMEQIKVTGKNISFTAISNRPLLNAIERPYHIPVKWRIIEGEIADAKLFETITKALEEDLNQDISKKKVGMIHGTRKAG
jgi:hypothetical protein